MHSWWWRKWMITASGSLSWTRAIYTFTVLPTNVFRFLSSPSPFFILTRAFIVVFPWMCTCIYTKLQLHLFLMVSLVLEVTLGYFLFDIILSIINKEHKFIDYFHHVVCSLIFIIAIKTGYTVEMCTTNLVCEVFFNFYFVLIILSSYSVRFKKKKWLVKHTVYEPLEAIHVH